MHLGQAVSEFDTNLQHGSLPYLPLGLGSSDLGTPDWAPRCLLLEGTWTLLDSADLDVRISMAIGYCGLISMAFMQHIFQSDIKKENKLLWLFGYHLYTYVVGILCVNLWRGTWGTVDYYTGTGPVTRGVSLLLGRLHEKI